MRSIDFDVKARVEDRGAAFLRLYSRHEHEVYGFIVSLVPNWADADEIMQDTCLRLWEQFDKFEPGTNFVAWALTIARYLVLAFRERTGRERAHFSLAFVEALASETERAQPVIEGRKRALAQCLESLPRSQRQLLTMVYEGDQPINRVAEALGRPAAATYQLISRVRRALFECVNRKLGARS